MRTVIKFNKSKLVGDLEHTRLQLEVREAELDTLLTQVLDNGFLEQTLGFKIDEKAGIDTTKLVVMGH